MNKSEQKILETQSQAKTDSHGCCKDKGEACQCKSEEVKNVMENDGHSCLHC